MSDLPPAVRRLWVAAALLAASCVPVATAEPLRTGHVPSPFAAAPVAPGQAPLSSPAPESEETVLSGDPALAANAALAIAAEPNPPARSFVVRARTPVDQMRSLDCLAEAVYYEARSESEDGQRAVAQVVLNRVRHPAWPNSVCGVVYQGPMRAGGGCQFTFTCDGSLAIAPAGGGWDRARRIAAAALAGRTFPAIGHSTHYHTHAVFPQWAPRLLKTAVIGSHNFYRLPGAWGGPAAFRASYAGIEPVPAPRPSPGLETIAVVPVLPVALPPIAQPSARSEAEVRAAISLPSDIPQDPRWAASRLPPSTVREEYRHSGQWRADAPAAITGG